jgi:hypothetical protein
MIEPSGGYDFSFNPGNISKSHGSRQANTLNCEMNQNLYGVFIGDNVPKKWLPWF